LIQSKFIDFLWVDLLSFLIRRCIITIAFLVLLVLFLVQFIPVCFAVSSVEAADAIRQAGHDLDVAFISVAEAEGAGANVSVFLDKLNQAGVFLSDANLAFRDGDYESSFYHALVCSAKIEGVAHDALSFKINAEIAHRTVLFWTAYISSIGVGLFFVLAFFGWRFLNKWYFRQVLEMKPVLEEA
jgi:hypothetical protein